ncbi:hypothetical protein AB0J28_09295 [Streptosporangium canum]|uniref:hypothetical protein n=1 Tax=Streptosporangium canum TaxID=324952 RepID=UPI0034188B61
MSPAFFAHWQSDGIFAQLSGLLRRSVCTTEGRNPEPTACVIYAQSIKTSANVPTASQGHGAGKKIASHQRSRATDTLGLLIAVLITAAGLAGCPEGTLA